jgi:hypothetical protein
MCPFTGSVVAMPPGGPIRTARTGPAVPPPVSRPCLTDSGSLRARVSIKAARCGRVMSCLTEMSNLLIMSGDMSKDVSDDKNLRRASWPCMPGSGPLKASNSRPVRRVSEFTSATTPSRISALSDLWPQPIARGEPWEAHGGRLRRSGDQGAGGSRRRSGPRS